ncbi:MAG: GNAT family N-acetyltransferase [Lachnospiraceae bacterium]|nr:GNAT family N-acetyltransferase [Lachnospiraceae bacterium]
MISIIPYNKKYDNEIQKLDRDIFLEVRYHRDVIKEDVILSVDETGSFCGIGYLLASQSYRMIDRSLNEYFLHAIFRGFGENEAEASILLLKRLLKLFCLHAVRLKGKNLKLRLWCKESDTAYLELLYENGFKPIDKMLVMKRSLSEKMPSLKDIFSKASENGISLVLTKARPDESFFNEYLTVNEEAFDLPDSLDDLRFKLDHYNGAIYAAFAEDTLAASVTVWQVGAGTLATENIFCGPRFQNKGIAKALLGYMLHELKKTEADNAALTVYRNNISAIRLYSSLGYEQVHTLNEMCYEVTK